MEYSFRKDALFCVILAAAVLFRFFPCGITYFPYLDDYAAYGVTHYLLADEGPFSLYTRYGMHTARPLAGLLDILVIAPLWRHMWLVLLLFALLHAATLPLMNAVLKYAGLPHGRLAAAVFGLYPLLGESVYWINAAARIVPGFFLLMLSAYNLCRYFEDERTRNLTAAVTAGLLSLVFYEQTAGFVFVLFIIIIINYRKHIAWLTWPFFYVGAMGAYYAVFLQAGRMASRAAQAGLSLNTLRDIIILLSKEQAYNAYSLLRIELPRLSMILLLISFTFTILITLSLDENKKPTHNRLFIIMSALFLSLGAFGPFFILRDSFLTLRSLYFVVPVMAMLAQWAWNGLSRHRFAALPAGAAIMLFMLMGAGSVNAFRVNHHDDRVIAGQIIDILYESSHPSEYRKVWLIGARHQFSPHGGVHLHSAALTDWSLSTLVNTYEMERFGARYISPDGGLFLHPVTDGHPFDGDFETENDLLLVVDENAAVRVVGQ
jgi:hypothetical protein